MQLTDGKDLFEGKNEILSDLGIDSDAFFRI
jgi:hypothetical protein